jgi:hypothetical protein
VEFEFSDGVTGKLRLGNSSGTLATETGVLAGGDRNRVVVLITSNYFYAASEQLGSIEYSVTRYGGDFVGLEGTDPKNPVSFREFEFLRWHREDCPLRDLAYFDTPTIPDED